MSDRERTSGAQGSSPYDEPTGTFRIPSTSGPDASADDTGVYGYEPYRRESDSSEPSTQALNAQTRDGQAHDGTASRAAETADQPATTALPTSAIPGATGPSPRTKAIGVDRDAFHREHNRYATRDDESVRPRAYADVGDTDPSHAPETRSLSADRLDEHDRWGDPDRAAPSADETVALGAVGRGSRDDRHDVDGRDDATAQVARRRRERRRDEYDDEGFRDNDIDASGARARRGTTDLGLFVLRAAVGIIAMAHGSQKLFGWWGGPRLGGFEAFLTNTPNPDIGFRSDAVKPLAIVGALSESLGGLMLVIGLLTPIAGSAVLGVMIVAATYKATLAGGVWFFAADGGGSGIEYEILIGVAAAAVILAGPGRLSLDFGRGWATRPFVGSVAWLVIGIAAPVVIWILLNGTNPFTSPGNPTPS